jgi:uncharacterized protein (UPF0332 family)
MAFDWNEFFRLANELKDRIDDEASLRSAVSRVYYSVYCQARNFLIEKKGFTFSTYEGSHQQVWKGFLHQGRTSRSIWRHGDSLHKNRVAADYEDEIKDLPGLVKDSFHRANLIVTSLIQLNKHPDN